MGQLSVRTRVLIGVVAVAIGLVFGWLTTSRDEARDPAPRPSGERVGMLPSSVTSPAPQSTSECRSIPLVRAEQSGPDALPETLGSYIPTYMPDGAGLFGTWHETLAEHGPGAVWVTEDCRTVKVTLVETKRPREGPWKIWMSRRCTVASIGKTMCIDASADVPGTHLNLTTAGFSENEAMRIAESIEL